ncbi:MAG: hypothetical protein QE487_10890 [Fluviicola sp.]|nr:hypothetical protein [Fluviicola sp.]
MIQLDIIDWGIWLFLAVTVGLLMYLYQRTSNFPGSPYLVRGYLLKVFGGLSFALIYIYYYGGGDSIEYFRSTSTLNELLASEPGTYFKLLSLNHEEAQPVLRNANKIIFYSHTAEEWFMVKLTSPFIFLGFNSYLGVTFLMSLLSFFGSFQLFQLMNKILPNRMGLVFGINFLIPTSLIWTSGLLKDTITFTCFAFLCSIFYTILYERKWRLFHLLFIPFIVYITLNLKAYIIISFAPWILITLLFFTASTIKNTVVKYLTVPIIIVIMVASGYLGINYMIQNNQEYNTENLFSKIRGFHTWHTQLGGSAYNLGEMEYTEIGLLKKVPAAINVSLFRPYPWESGSALVLLNSFESMCMILLVVWMFLKVRLRFFKHLFKNPFLIGGLVFCLFFAFSIGITSYNFGALSRFKVPLTAIFVFIMIYVIHQERISKSKSEERIP